MCHEVGLDAGEVVIGSDIETLSDDELANLAQRTTLFARLTPMHKERIVTLLKVCHEVGLDAGEVVIGSDIETLSDDELANLAQRTTLFARLTPMHKERIVTLLKREGHVVGFMGDGINDAPALRAADIGISVDCAVDIAR